MTDKLPPQLLALFAPRPPLRYLPPADTTPEKRRTPGISGLAKFLSELPRHDQDYVATETEEQKKIKRRIVKATRQQKHLRDGNETCIFPGPGCVWLMLDNPSGDPQARGDPYCTLFVSRLSFDTTENDLEREFTRFGPIERVNTPVRLGDC